MSFLVDSPQRVIGIDTAATCASVAVVADGELLAEGLSADESTLHQNAPARRRANHAQILIPLLDQVLRKARLTIAEISAIAVSIGPGSFTGLRIGLSCVKGLAYAANIAVAGIPTLTALAARVDDWEGLICPILDARKKEVYSALFYKQAGTLDRLCEDAVEPPVATIEKVLVSATKGPCLFIGEGVRVYGDMIERALGNAARFTSGSHYSTTASAVARLGTHKIVKSGPDSLERLVPLYLRPSEAELHGP